jgi:hypothetical protein
MQISIVLTGYYFKYLNLYQKIIAETKLYPNYKFNLYILSHKTKEEIQEELYTYLINNEWKIIFKPNIGWDWGCHVQFMQWHNEFKIQDDDYILFLHDDITITNNGFIQAFLNKTKRGYELIGNSTPFTSLKSYKKRHNEEAYILQKNGLDFAAGLIKIVRGSAFFLSFKLAKQTLLNLPYQKCGNINLANRSLRMFGSIVTKIVGANKIGYLSKEHFRSKHIAEEMRGNEINFNFFIKLFLNTQLLNIFQFFDKIVLSKVILKHSYPIVVQDKLKINFSERTILSDYLNISIKNNFCSDIDLQDFERLIRENLIYRVLISDNTAFDNDIWFEKLLGQISKSNISVDILIDAENAKEEETKNFAKKYRDFDISIEKKPIKMGRKWVNQLYLKHPHNNFKH